MLKKVVMLMSVVAVSTLFTSESNAGKEKNEINTPKKKKNLSSRKRVREFNTPNQENQKINTPDAPTKKKVKPEDSSKRRFRKSTARHYKTNLNNQFGEYHVDDRDQFGSDATE